MIIERTETDDIKRIKKWLLVYGRRKTGKTFLVKKFLNYNNYFFVKKDRNIISEKDNTELSYETFLALLKRDLSENKTVVIDEFHRLGDDFLDFLHYTEKKGKIILISSTLHLSKKLFAANSPILGLFSEFTIGLLSIGDIIRHMKSFKLDKKIALELAILFREPIAIEYFDRETESRKLISDVVRHSIRLIPALIGEVFTEEEKSISSVYEGILRAIAVGKHISSGISSYLFSRKLIKKDDPSLIQQYLLNLMEFGIIKRVKCYNKNKFIYKHISPLAKIFYYADEKYNISERNPSLEEIKRIVDEILPKIVEDTVRELLAEKMGLEENILETKDFDIDACLVKFKKIDTTVEIKWKDRIRDKEIEKIIENLEKVNPKTKLLFVPDKTKIKTKKIKVVDIFDFV